MLAMACNPPRALLRAAQVARGGYGQLQRSACWRRRDNRLLQLRVLPAHLPLVGDHADGLHAMPVFG